MLPLGHSGTALITGASMGIGSVYADRLARRGHDLILVARHRPRLEDFASLLRNRWGVSVETLPADLTQKAELLRVEQRLRDDPAITMLINNAGTTAPAALVGADTNALEQVIQLNITAVTRLAAAAATAFASRRRGTVVNIASVTALLPDLFNGTYSGSKAFVLNLTQSMQSELKGCGVRVQAVLPGAVRTDIWKHAETDVSTLPPGMVMEAEECVDAALAGLDHGETVTIPSLPDPADWEAFAARRRRLEPNLSRNRAAERYRTATG